MKQCIGIILTLLFSVPCHAQWQDTKFPDQVLAFGVHDTNLFLSNVPLDQGRPQSYLDSLVFRYQGGAWIALGRGIIRNANGSTRIYSFASLGSNFYCDGIYLTANNGDTWTALGAGGTLGTCGDYLFGEHGSLYFPDSNILLRSPDGGLHWDSIRQFRANDVHLWGGATVALAAVDNNSLWRSTDAGSTWIPVSTPIDNIQSFAASRSFVYATNGTQLIKSTDSGGTWTLVNTSFNVAYLATDSTHLFAGGPTGVYYLDSQSGNWINENGDSAILKNRGIVALGVFDTLLFADFASSAHQNYQLFMRSIPEITQKSGVAEALKSDLALSIYPNPASGAATISLTGAPSANVEIFDVLGRVVASFRVAGSYEWQMSALPAGAYIVRAEVGGSVLSRRVAKE